MKRIAGHMVALTILWLAGTHVPCHARHATTPDPFAAPPLVADAAEADGIAFDHGGKLLLTGGVSQFEGAAGGGLAPWAVIGGYGTRDQIGANAFYTGISVPDYHVNTVGALVDGTTGSNSRSHNSVSIPRRSVPHSDSVAVSRFDRTSSV